MFEYLYNFMAMCGVAIEWRLLDNAMSMTDCLTFGDHYEEVESSIAWVGFFMEADGLTMNSDVVTIPNI